MPWLPRSAGGNWFVVGAWGVRKSDPELRKALDAYLAEFRRQPGWSRLLVKYFGEDALLALGQEPVE